MDLRQYFKKIREIQETIPEAYVMLASLETSDGGKGGTLSEVTREQAAKLIVEARARLASDSETQRHVDTQAATKKAVEKAEMARRLQVTIVSDSSQFSPESCEKATGSAPRK